MDQPSNRLYSPLRMPNKLVPNSIYSLASLSSSSPLATPLTTTTTRYNSSSPLMHLPPMSAPPIANNTVTSGGGRDQYFFGSDFNPLFQASAYQQSSSHQLLDSGGSSTLIGGSSGGDGVKHANSTESLFLNDFSDQFNSLLNLRSPLHVPQSAPQFNLNGTGSSSSGMMHQYNSRKHNHKVNQPQLFSLKVFLGGIPTNLTTNIIQLNFAKFGQNFIDWPKKKTVQDRPPDGYAFVVFDQEQSIVQMLGSCQQANNRVFIHIYTLNGLMYPVEVKVWEMRNTIYANQIGWRKFRRFSVFVGGIPRTCTALMLSIAVEEVIGPVAYCAIELDQNHFYPKGAACIVFTTKESYIKSIAAHEVALNFGTFERKVEFKPFLASNMPCENCGVTNGTCYCSEMICLAYFCQNCWKLTHNARPSMSVHQPSKRQHLGRGQERDMDEIGERK